MSFLLKCQVDVRRALEWCRKKNISRITVRRVREYLEKKHLNQYTIPFLAKVLKNFASQGVIVEVEGTSPKQFLPRALAGILGFHASKFNQNTNTRSENYGTGE